MAGGPDTVGNLKPRFGGVFLVAGFGFAGAGEHAGYGLRINALRQGLNDVGFVVMNLRRLRSNTGMLPLPQGPGRPYQLSTAAQVGLLPVEPAGDGASRSLGQT